jgi:MFS family permease
MARRLVSRPGLLLLLATAFLIQFAVPLVRMATTYRALSIGMSPEIVGFLAAAFAALPVLFVVWFGRMTDRHGVRPGIAAGAIIVVLAIAFLWLAPPSLPTLLSGMALLGLGQTLHYSGLQMVVLVVAGRRHRDNTLGSYLLAMTLGDALAPLLLGTAGTADTAALSAHLYSLAMIFAVVLLVSAGLLCRAVPFERRTRHSPAPLLGILRSPGMAPILVAGSLCATVQDMLATYVPVLGVERGLPPAVVGLIMTTMALSSVASRGSYGRLARLLGRHRLAIIATIGAGIGIAVIGLPLPVWGYFLAMPLVGFGLGSAGTATVALVMQLAPAGARGTAMSLRQLTSRIGLFSMPFGANVAAGFAGLAGIFGLLAASICGAGLLVWKSSAAVTRSNRGA